MIYKPKYISRLMKLADHLASGNLHYEYVPMSVPEDRTHEQPPIYMAKGEFTFAFYTFIVDELPFLFPEQWKEVKGEPVHVSHPGEVFEAAADFFGLSPAEYIHLFVPLAQIPGWGGKKLMYDAAPRDVSFNIRELLSRHIRMN